MQGGKSNTDVGEKKETPSGPKGNASKQKKNPLATFEVVAAVLLRIQVFCNVTPCQVVIPVDTA
jgi:hypothetical protein